MTWRLKRDYGPEWWNHPDLTPELGELEYAPETALDLLVEQVRLFIAMRENELPIMTDIYREGVESAAQDLARAMDRRDTGDSGVQM